MQDLYNVNIYLLSHVGCVTGDLRATRGDVPETGKLFPLYCFNEEWRGMCTGGSIWTENSARVACRQLGYKGYSKLKLYHWNIQR